MEEIHDCMRESAAEAVRVMRSVPETRLDADSLLPGWSVRDLVNHIIAYTSHGLEARGRRAELDPDIAGRDFTARPGWRDDYAAAIARAVEAWGDPDAWVGEVDAGGMMMSAPRVAALLVAETALHTWDLAVSTSRTTVCDGRVAELVHAEVAEVAEMFRRYDGFGSPVPVAEDATTFARALGMSGRDPALAG